MFSVPLPLLAEVTCNCTIPSVEHGKMTTLTCHFNMNMRENRGNIVVRRKTNASAERGDYNGFCLQYLVLFLCNFCTFLCSFSNLCMWFFFCVDKLGQVLVINQQWLLECGIILFSIPYFQDYTTLLSITVYHTVLVTVKKKF